MISTGFIASTRLYARALYMCPNIVRLCVDMAAFFFSKLRLERAFGAL